MCSALGIVYGALVKVAVVRETVPHEQRVALVPDVLSRLIQAGLDVVVETGAGVAAHHPDQAFVEAGAKVSDDPLAEADVIVSVQPLGLERIEQLSPGTITVSFLPVAGQPETVAALRDRSITAFSLELVPRISRAQSMDVLSSQALVAGYRAVIVAAERLPGFFPLLMTAAGTVPPLGCWCWARASRPAGDRDGAAARRRGVGL